MMPNVLVTGHLGFIGQYLIKELEKITTVVGIDLKEGENILSCKLPEVAVVIHLAAQPGVINSMKDPIHTVNTNITGTVRLLQHYKDAKFIFASSGGTIQETIECPYGLSKFCGEEFVKLMHDNYSILRFANVYGKNSRSVIDKFLREDKITIYGDGSAMRTYVYIDDLVSGIIDSIDWETGTYHFGSSQNHSVKEIADLIGKPITYKGWREGELKNATLKNTTPNWQPKMDVKQYIKEAKC
jgi:UDP-glucose 4-epimerase